MRYYSLQIWGIFIQGHLFYLDIDGLKKNKFQEPSELKVHMDSSLGYFSQRRGNNKKGHLVHVI